ncbi:MAG: hypothetical protein AAF628_37735 [Planctomycetota bacterium]
MRSHRRFVVAGLLAFLAACGGGGGGSSLPVPTIVAAAFVGSGATPAAGEFLILLLSQDVELTGELLDDNDVSLSSGTLGSVSAMPSLVNARSVRITLGSGVSLSTGVTIAFAPDNDAVRSPAGQLADGGTPVGITAGDGDLPTVSLLTLSGVPEVLNGTGAAGGTLQVPPTGFTIDVEHTDATSAIDGAATSITANVAAGGVAAGGELASLFTASPGAAQSNFTVPSSLSFPEGPVTFSVVVVDITGMSSTPVSFACNVKSARNDLRPLESGQTWFLDTSRDLESYTHVAASNPILVTAGDNGRPDLEDLYFILGLFGSDSAVNATVRTQIQDAVVADLGTLFSGVNVTFTFSSPGSFPSSGRVAYSSGTFSQICVTGSDSGAFVGGASQYLVLGLALFDPNNAFQDDDCIEDFMGSRLGVFMHTLANAGLSSASSSMFRMTYDDLTPGVSGSVGTPIGDDAQDAARLAGSVTDTRATTISNAIARFARAVSVIVAHECGHSMGLVQDGAMPLGLYGDSGSFPGSSSGHINNDDSLFPGAAQNVMSPLISFSGAVNSGTGFNGLNLAYLRERVLYGN